MRIALAFTATLAWGGCFSFVPSSDCQDDALQWAAPAQTTVSERLGRVVYDQAIDQPGIRAGLVVRGEQRFRLTAKGRHFVEVFLSNPEIDRYSFRLMVNGSNVDERPLIAPGPGRMRPKNGLRHVSLLAWVDGPAELAVQSDAPLYMLSAVRWTPGERFETDLVPKWRERARWLQTNILREATPRRNGLQQLHDRLAFSADKSVREEALLGRTRAWFWVAAENHEPDDLLQTVRLFEEGLRTIPGDPVLREMISASCGALLPRMPSGDFCQAVSPVPWNVDVPLPPAGAPEWAVAQRALMRRVHAITRWWVEKRQAPTGELGGGWGDDVEILRQWGPQALGFGSKVAALGTLNVAGGLWKSGMLLNGYDKGISDVEHSSEPTTDTQPLAAALEPGNSEIVSRLKQTAACAEHWLKPQQDGFLRFRSSWFNCRDADTRESRAVDVHLNARAMGPALWYAYLSRDPGTVRLLSQWADSWIAAMRQTAHGKPAGAIPPAVRSRDGSYLIGGQGWDKPEAEWDYFRWSGESQEALTSLMLAVYDLTGSRNYLDAAGESFAPCAQAGPLCTEMKKAPGAFYTWRKITGDSRYDNAFGYKPGAQDALAELTRLARDTERRYSTNFRMYTSEVLYTDRVYYQLPAEYRQYLFGGEAPRGDRYPSFAVTWPVSDVEFARAVLSDSPESLELRLFSFATSKANATFRLWRLKPGRYSWQGGEFTVERLPHTLTVELPPGRELSVLIRRVTAR